MRFSHWPVVPGRAYGGVCAFAHRHRLALKGVASLVSAAFLLLTLQPLAIAANQGGPTAPATRALSNEERLAKHLEAIETQLGQFEAKLTKKADASREKSELKTLRQDLDTLDTQALKDFDAIEAHLKAKNLPTVIQNRHTEAVTQYKTEMAALKANLDDIDREVDDARKGPKVTKAKEHLKAKQKRRAHSPFDPKSVPGRAPKLKERAPRTRKDEFAELTPPIRVAAVGDLAGLVSPAYAVAPTPEDLLETPDVQFTTDIQKLVTLFEKDPIRLYEFVRNNFAFDPYYGSVRGSQGTLMLQSGNDMDQASVLIALYRAAGIPARYVYGTVEIPIEKAMKWVGGATNPKVAGEALLTNGIPARLAVVGGAYKFVQLEHVWVEAYLPYDNYRGVISDPNGKKSWVSLDPSFKLHDPNPKARDLARDQGFDIDTFTAQYLATVKTDTPAKAYLRNSIDFVANNIPGERIYDLLSSGPITEKTLELLPNTLPFPIKVIGNRFSTVPDSLRHRVTFELGAAQEIDISSAVAYTAPVFDLTHKRLTVSYEPATPEDAQVIATYGNLYDTPPYLIQVKPLLKFDGTTVAEGSAVRMGEDLAIRLTFRAANGEYQGAFTNPITAGAPQAIAIASGLTNGRAVTDRTNKWEAAVVNNESGESIIGEFLNLLAVTYLQELASSRKITSRTMNILDTNIQAEAMVGVELTINYSFGIPRSAAIAGLQIDVDRNTSAVLSADGDHGKTVRYKKLIGLTSSSLEHDVFEKILSEPTLPVQAISAIKAIQIANTQGIPVHTIDQSNADLIPTLNLAASVKVDLEAAVYAGMQATVAQQNITLNNWTGTGYIITDPITGTGAYRISGGMNGGSLTWMLSSLNRMIKDGEILPKEGKTAQQIAAEFIRKHKDAIWFPSPTEHKGVGVSPRGWRTRNGVREFHDGADIGVPIGTRVYAVAKGVAEVKPNRPGFGNYVLINHGFGVYTVYGHLQSFAEGIDRTIVEEGQPIGDSGNTGTETTGAHLHFSIYLTTGESTGDYPLYRGGVFNSDASVDPNLLMRWTEAAF